MASKTLIVIMAYLYGFWNIHMIIRLCTNIYHVIITLYKYVKWKQNCKSVWKNNAKYFISRKKMNYIKRCPVNQDFFNYETANAKKRQ